MKIDAELLRDARRDAKAFRVVYERHVARVFRMLRHETGQADVAMDLTAETFARALGGAKSFRPGGLDPSAAPWLFGIARNVLREYRRDRSAARHTCERLGIERWDYDTDALEGIDERLDACALAPALNAALDALPEGQRCALQMRVIEERSYQDVAASLGCSPLGARLRVMRALRALKIRMQGAPL